MKFIGRKKELDSLELLLKKKSASLVVIRSRRRVGKSRLIKEFVLDKKAGFSHDFLLFRESLSKDN